jgi:hypothetical protein
MAQNMGFDYGDGSLIDPRVCFKRKYRWRFTINGVVGSGSPCLPASKSGRPSLSFKEMEAPHLVETIYFPSKPDWKPITLTLYDIKKQSNPVIDWIKKTYEIDENSVTWKPSSNFKISRCNLELYDGVGEVIEFWELHNVWPNNIEFGDLDYQSSEVVTIDLTLRYDRARLIQL